MNQVKIFHFNINIIDNQFNESLILFLFLTDKQFICLKKYLEAQFLV